MPQGYIGCEVGINRINWKTCIHGILRKSQVTLLGLGLGSRAPARLRANKLLYRSVVFESMLKQNMREAQTNEVDIPDVDPDTLKLMLDRSSSTRDRWAFACWNVGTITLLSNIITLKVNDENYTAELLYAADKYELSDLVNI